ncbi:polycystin-1-like protein 1 [Diadema antillarum]|uniref:polycystin-1-like protein 1 n=1 Tax=Diadema antillarum TaxID=105358 RepID=UPI003A87562B
MVQHDNEDGKMIQNDESQNCPENTTYFSPVNTPFDGRPVDRVWPQALSEHVFREKGLFTVTVNASNSLGSVLKVLHVIVMDRGVSNLSVSLLEGSLHTRPNVSHIFLLSMETADREHAMLLLDFGDGVVYNQSLRDVNETFISGGSANPANLYLTASYGDGCQLLVSFSHEYSSTGHFDPAVHVLSNGTLYAGGLLQTIVVQEAIPSVSLDSQESFPLHSNGTISSVVPVTTGNMSYEWTVSLENVTIASVVTTSKSFVHNFAAEGRYLVKVTVRNLVSTVSDAKVITVQREIQDVSVWSESENSIMALEESVLCQATTEDGTGPTFLWDFDDGSSFEDFGLQSNADPVIVSSINHTFAKSGEYNISVTVQNLVSTVTRRLGKPLVIQEPVSGITAQSARPSLVGSPAEIAVELRRGSHVQFHRVSGEEEQVLEAVMAGNQSYVVQLQLEPTGLHDINISASNNVSQLSTPVKHLVLPYLGNLSVSRFPISSNQIALLVDINGTHPGQMEAVFHWNLGENNVSTGSSLLVIEKSELPSESLLLTVTNQVGNQSVDVPVMDAFQAVPVLFDHSHHVDVEAATSFNLSMSSVASIQSVEVTCENQHDKSNHTMSVTVDDPTPLVSWHHNFPDVGVYVLSVVVMTVDDEMFTHNSAISVQEQIESISLTGPDLTKFLWPSTTQTWEMMPSLGTDILYTWRIKPVNGSSSSGGDYSVVMGGAHTLGYLPFTSPGLFNLSLTAANQISSTAISVLTTLREPITEVVASCAPVLHGLESQILVTVQGGPEFDFHVSFADGLNATLTSVSSKVSIEYADYSTSPPTFVYAIGKNYTSLGDYKVVVVVSNGISEQRASTVARVEERITGLTISTSDSWLINLRSNITMMASVATGNDVIFTWNFNDAFGPTTVTYSNGSYSSAVHTFAFPGEYIIGVSAHNALQSDPVVYNYPSTFIVQQVPEALELSVIGGATSASLLSNGASWATSTVEFRAFCWGSHIDFFFDYGDGTIEVVEGVIDEYGSFSGDGQHVYTSEGEYTVTVTAGNQLTNISQTLREPFYVEVPPTNLHFSHDSYSFPFGNRSVLTVDVAAGSNLYYNWSMGDQTNYIFEGPTVSHVYRTAGVYQVIVVAFNKVQSLQTWCDIRILNYVSFVELKVASQLVPTQTRITFTADTPSNSANSFVWDLGNNQAPKTTSVSSLSHTYRTPGTYYVTVVAINIFGNATSQPLEMTLQAEIATLVIKTSSSILIEEATVFQAQLAAGSNVEFEWDFGDGSSNLVTDQAAAIHTFNRTAEYFVTLTASNGISNATTTRNIFVLSEPCSAPSLGLVGGSSRTVKFSEPVRVEIEISIDCDITDETVYRWMLFHADNGSRLMLDPHHASLRKRTLYIASHVVPLGQYQVTLEVRMNNTIVYAQVSLTLTIVESPLVAVVEGGTTRTIDSKMPVYLNGGFSFDPDHPNDADLRYNWTCRLMDNPAELCFDSASLGNHSAPLPAANESVVFPSSLLRIDLTYWFVFYLTVSKGDRAPVTVSQVIKVVSTMENMYEVLVDCPSCDEGFVNSNTELTLEALCPTCGDNVTMVWELFVVFDGTTVDTNTASRCWRADGSGPVSSGVVSTTTAVAPPTSHSAYTITSGQSSPSTPPSDPGSTTSQAPTNAPQTSRAPTSTHLSSTIFSTAADGTGSTDASEAGPSTTPLASTSTPPSSGTVSTEASNTPTPEPSTDQPSSSPSSTQTVSTKGSTTSTGSSANITTATAASTTHTSQGGFPPGQSFSETFFSSESSSFAESFFSSIGGGQGRSAETNNGTKEKPFSTADTSDGDGKSGSASEFSSGSRTQRNVSTSKSFADAGFSSSVAELFSSSAAFNAPSAGTSTSAAGSSPVEEDSFAEAVSSFAEQDLFQQGSSSVAEVFPTSSRQQASTSAAGTTTPPAPLATTQATSEGSTPPPSSTARGVESSSTTPATNVDSLSSSVVEDYSEDYGEDFSEDLYEDYSSVPINPSTASTTRTSLTTAQLSTIHLSTTGTARHTTSGTTSGTTTPRSTTTPQQVVEDYSSLLEESINEDSFQEENPLESGGTGDSDNNNNQNSDDNGDPVANLEDTYEEHIVAKRRQPVVISEDSTTTGLKGGQLTLRDGLLEEGRTYAVAVKIYEEDGGAGQIGEAFQYVTVNEAPKWGACTRLPDQGTELETTFSVDCHSWQDDDLPLLYEIRYSLNQSDPETILYYGMDSSIRFLLPAGHAENNHNVYLKLAIVDSQGAKTSVCDIAIPVTPKEFGSLEEKLNYLSEVTLGSSSDLGTYVARGDQLNIHSHVRLVAHLLNNLSHHDEEDEDMEHCHNIAERCDIRSALLDGIQALSIRNEYEILQAVGATVEATAVPEEMSTECQKKTSNLLVALAASSAAYRWAEPSSARDALAEMLTVVSNMFESYHHNHTGEPLDLNVKRAITERMIASLSDMLQVYLGHMTTQSAPVTLDSPLLTLQGSRVDALGGARLVAGGASFTLPEDLDGLLGHAQAQGSSSGYQWNYPCYSAHMATYADNPYVWGNGFQRVTTPVTSLELYTCHDETVSPIVVGNLPSGQEVVIDIDNMVEEFPSAFNFTFDPAYMSVHEFNVTTANIQQSLHLAIELTPIDHPVPVSVLLRYDREPTPTQYDMRWDHDENVNNIHIFLVPDTFNNSGRYYLALMDGEFGQMVYRQNGDLSRQYMLKMWWGECLYWNVENVMWSPEGCSTSSSSTFSTTQCRCNHLSSFGVSFLPIFSTLGFIDMQLFVDSNENPVPYMFVAVLLGAYALLFVYCYYADCHDEKKKGLIFLKDNQPGDQQYYDVTVETGFRTGAGTTARISIVLHGDEGHSETKELTCDDRPIFERNSRDRFVISTPESLGNIQRLQLWHNNAGLSPSWYLSRISIRDLLTGNKWFFICERWFAVEEDDGKIERELKVVEDGVGFQKAFFAKGAQYFADYYIWSSIFTRPPYSVFTRVQRLTCCLCISMGFMCINTLWYQKLDNQDAELGVYDLSGEAVLVGIVTALLAIPINFPLIMLFRRSKPASMPGEIGELYKHIESHSKPQPDPEEQTAAQLYNLQRWAKEKWKHRHKSSIFKHLTESESGRSSIDANSLSSGFGDFNTMDKFRAIFTDSGLSSPDISESLESLGGEPVPSMHHKKLRSPKIWLPHCFLYLAWTLSITIISVSAVVTIVLGLKFSYSQAIYWMQSLYFSFLQCIFVTQPSVMAMFTIAKAWKHSCNIKIFDHYDDNTDLIDKRMLRRSRLQLYEQDLSKAIAARQRSRYLRFARPPQPKELQKAKEKMLKEKHMYAILTDLLLFVMLSWCLVWMAYGTATAQHHPFNNSVKQAYLETPHPFSDVRTVDDLWAWLQEDMMDTLYQQRWSCQDPALDNSVSMTMMGESILLGKPSLRQSRVRDHSCSVPSEARSVIQDCQAGYTEQTKSKAAYGPGGQWVYQTAQELGRYCKWGMFSSYKGDGYAVSFNNTRVGAEALLQHLRNNSWIDSQTRAVILEFTLYNAPYNLFSAISFIAELPGTGAVYPLTSIEAVQLYKYEQAYDYFIMSCELLFVLLVAVVGKQEVVKAVKQKTAYFRSTWSWVEVMLIFVSLIYFAMYVYRFAYVSEAGSLLKETYLEEFVDLSFLAWWDQRLRDLIGLVVFILTLKFLYLMRFNHMFAMFGAFVEAALAHIMLHMLYYFILETAFSCLGSQLFGRHYFPLKDAYLGYEVMSTLIVGSVPDHSDLRLLYPILWPMFYISYIICMIIIMAGLIKAILCHSYRKVKHCPLETVQSQEVVLFFWHRFLCWLGIRTEQVDDSDRDKLPMEFTMAEIQYQVDELAFRMNAILHQNGLPDKPIDYLDDSDATQNYHDDGISSYPSEEQEFDGAKFEERVQRLEEQLYHNNPELRELMTSPEDETDPDRHKELRARLELEIFRQLQLSRQRDQIDDSNDDASVIYDGSQTNSGRMSASASVASYGLEEGLEATSALSSSDMGRPGLQRRQSTATRTEDGFMAFPQPMENLGTLQMRTNIQPKNTKARQAWSKGGEDAPIKSEEHQRQRRKKKLLAKLPRPHTAAVFPIRESPSLSADDGVPEDVGGAPERIQHKDSNVSTMSSSSGNSRYSSSSVGAGSWHGGSSGDSRSQGSSGAGDAEEWKRRQRNLKTSPLTRYGWNEEDSSSQTSVRSGGEAPPAKAVESKPKVTTETHARLSPQSPGPLPVRPVTSVPTVSRRRGTTSVDRRPSPEEVIRDRPLGFTPDLTVSMESFPLPNALEQLDSDSSEAAAAADKKSRQQPADSTGRSQKRKKGREGTTARTHRLRKTKSRGKGKGRSRLQGLGHSNEGYTSDSPEEEDIPVIQMSRPFFPDRY